jgi:hypothetical protein
MKYQKKIHFMNLGDEYSACNLFVGRKLYSSFNPSHVSCLRCKTTEAFRQAEVIYHVVCDASDNKFLNWSVLDFAAKKKELG